MTIETASFINGLNASYPAASDPKSEGDDHLRLIKTTVKATFPNLTGAVTPTQADLNVLAGAASGAVSGLNVATQAASNNTTLAASTAMVQAAILASSGVTAALPGQSGNSGKYLTTDGSSASWGALPSNDLVLLSTTTVSTAVNAVTITSGFTNAYKAFAVLIENLTRSGPSSGMFALRVRRGGSVVTSSTYGTSYCTRGNTGNTTSSSNDHIPLGAGSLNASGWIHILNPFASSAGAIRVIGELCESATTTNSPTNWQISGMNSATGTFDGIQLYNVDTTWGLVDANTVIRVYGVK